MKESLKISKSFVCTCGRDHTLELSTDLAVDSLVIEASCPSCGERRSITAGSLLLNQAVGQVTNDQSSNSESQLSFMESEEDEQAKTENKGESDESICTDMFE
ncbi:MAG: hypothetical protein ABIG39_00835 [Candidatus Micrarchaeota archaeon]